MAVENNTPCVVLQHTHFDREPVKNPRVKGRKRSVISLSAARTKSTRATHSDPIVEINKLIDSAPEDAGSVFLKQWIVEARVLLIRIETALRLSGSGGHKDFFN